MGEGEKKKERKKLRRDDKGSEHPPYLRIEPHTVLTGENRQTPGRSNKISILVCLGIAIKRHRLVLSS